MYCRSQNLTCISKRHGIITISNVDIHHSQRHSGIIARYTYLTLTHAWKFTYITDMHVHVYCMRLDNNFTPKQSARFTSASVIILSKHTLLYLKTFLISNFTKLKRQSIIVRTSGFIKISNQVFPQQGFCFNIVREAQKQIIGEFRLN